MRIRMFTAALALTVLGALTGCGSSTPHASTSTVARVLTKAQVRSAVLHKRDLGTNFRVDNSSGGGESSLGCLDRFGKLDKVSPTVRGFESDFAAKSQIALPVLFSSVFTFRTTAVATKGMAWLRKLLGTCTAVDVHGKDGTRIRLSVSYDQKPANAQVDEQVNIEASGAIEFTGHTVPMSVDLAIIRIGNDVDIAGFGTIGLDSRPQLAQVVDASLVRFIPVTQGEPPGTPTPLHFEAITRDMLLQNVV